ncbi:MAG: hypothetical protein ABSA18_07420 [Dehalococcoidia bacterium]|jgi:hypothetical protein
MEISWTQIVIAIVALYGAGISTYNLIIARSKGVRKVKVDLSYGYFIQGKSIVKNLTYSDSSTHLIVSIINIGFRPFTITQLYFTLPKYKGKLGIVRPQSHIELPHEFKESEEATFWIELGSVAGMIHSLDYKGIVKLAISTSDSTGMRTKSNSIKFNVGQLAGKFQDAEPISVNSQPPQPPLHRGRFI